MGCSLDSWALEGILWCSSDFGCFSKFFECLTDNGILGPCLDFLMPRWEWVSFSPASSIMGRDGLCDFWSLEASVIFFWSYTSFSQELNFSSDWTMAMLFDLLRDGWYWGAGRRLLIIPRFLGHLMVERRFSHFGSSPSGMSRPARVPVKWFNKPGVARILSQDGLFWGFTWRQLLTIWARSMLKWLGIGSKMPLVTFWLSPYMLFALNGGMRVIIS